MNRRADFFGRGGVPEAEGVFGLFRLTDESSVEIAAVNAAAAGGGSLWTGLKDFFGKRRPVGRASVISVPGGLRFRRDAGSPKRWVALMTEREMPEGFVIEFDYVPHSVFREQLQFDWRMSSLGDRMRILVRDNECLVSNVVEERVFGPDLQSVPFAFAMDAVAHVRIEVRPESAVLAVDGVERISAVAHGPRKAGNLAALIFYEDSSGRTMDFEIRNFRWRRTA